MDIETENRMLEQEISELRAKVHKLEYLLEQEQDDFESLQNKCEKLHSLLDVARCMMDKREADLLTNHAEMIGITL